MIKISKYPLIIALYTIIYTNISMALEEPKYQIIKSNKNYEIRKYKDRLVVEAEYSNEDSGFRYLFNYISGENTSLEKISMTVPVTQSVKIDMTAPVTQTTKENKMLMQFFFTIKIYFRYSSKTNK
jgi:SOUL heme-binding protein.